MSSLDFGYIFRLYSASLRENPLRTKTATSALISAAANVAAQLVRHGGVIISPKSALAFLLFGGGVIAPITHRFYAELERLVPRDAAFAGLKRLLVDRLAFTPFLVFVTVYALEILHLRLNNLTKTANAKFWPTLVAHWKIWTLPQFVNVCYVPLEYRVLFANAVAFFWNIYLASTDNAASKRN